MSTVTAIYENGVFRPLEKVDLPESLQVEVSLPDPVMPPLRAGLAAIYEVMAERYDGEPDDAARVDPARKPVRDLLAGSGAGAALIRERERERRRG